MKKFTIGLLLALLLVPFLIWAGGQEESGLMRLTIAGRDGAYGDGMQLAADEYAKSHPNVTFEVLKLSGASVFEKTVIDMKAGAGTYDLIMIDDPNAPQFQKAGWLTDLDALYKKNDLSLDADFIPTLIKLGRYPYSDSGTLYAMPHVGNVELFAYRTDLFKKYGFGRPEKWDDVLAAAKAIKAGEPEISAVLFRGAKGNPIVTGFLPIFWSFGAKILENGKPVLDSPEALNALNFYLELAKFAPEGVSMYQSAQVKDAIYSGKGAMAIEVWPGWIKNLDNPAESAVVGKVEVIKHPGQVKKSSPLIGVWLLGIPDASKHKDTAFDFLQFITSADVQEKLSGEAGIPPTRKSVHEIQALIDKYAWYPAQLEGLQNGVGRPRTNKWKEIEAALGTYLQLALIGDLSAEEALNKANDKIKEIVQ